MMMKHLLLLISIFIFQNCNRYIDYNIKKHVENTCFHAELLANLDSTKYIKDTLFLFREDCDTIPDMHFFCNHVFETYIFFHPCFTVIENKNIIKESFRKNVFCFANAQNIYKYYRFNMIEFDEKNEYILDSLLHLKFGPKSSFKFIPDSIIYFKNKKLKKGTKISMCGALFEVTYVNAHKMCIFHFNNPNTLTYNDTVNTRMKFIVDLKQVKK